MTKLNEILSLYLQNVKKNHKINVKIKNKNGSKILRLIRPILELFNKNYWKGYITTLLSTIWIPDKWSETTDVKTQLEIVTHEVIHMKRSKQLSFFVYAILYLFPQILVLLSLFAFLAIPFGTSWLFCLLFLIFLAPIPAPFRYLIELEAYRTRLIIYKYAWNATPEKIEFAKDDIINNLSKGDYYFAWPFPKAIKKHLNNENKLDDIKYKEIVKFLTDNGLYK